MQRARRRLRAPRPPPPPSRDSRSRRSSARRPVHLQRHIRADEEKAVAHGRQIRDAAARQARRHARPARSPRRGHETVDIDALVRAGAISRAAARWRPTPTARERHAAAAWTAGASMIAYERARPERPPQRSELIACVRRIRDRHGEQSPAPDGVDDDAADGDTQSAERGATGGRVSSTRQHRRTGHQHERGLRPSCNARFEPAQPLRELDQQGRERARRTISRYLSRIAISACVHSRSTAGVCRRRSDVTRRRGVRTIVVRRVPPSTTSPPRPRWPSPRRCRAARDYHLAEVRRCRGAADRARTARTRPQRAEYAARKRSWLCCRVDLADYSSAGPPGARAGSSSEPAPNTSLSECAGSVEISSTRRAGSALARSIA